MKRRYTAALVGLGRIAWRFNSEGNSGSSFRGREDVLAKQMEIEAIASHVRDGQRILDVGCGNGVTAIELARRFSADVTGVDYTSEMVTKATELAAKQNLRGSVCLLVADITGLAGTPAGPYVLIYTERTLINLPDWKTQKATIENTTSRLADGGLYAMCENSQDGLDKVNLFRTRVGLPKIEPPWHDRYLRESEIAEVTIANVKLDGCVYYSTTYYFLSRVVNAWEAAQLGKDPDYYAPVNQLALKLPPVGDFGQGRLWLWRKVT